MSGQTLTRFGSGRAGGVSALPAVSLRSCALAIAGLLAGCGPADNDPGPGGVTVGEARALDEAAEMLDARSLAPVADDARNRVTPPPPAD